MINLISDPSYLLPPLIAVAVTLFLITVALIWSSRNFSTVLFCGLLLSMVIWNLLVFGMRASSDVHYALIWSKATIIPATAAFVFYYHFTLVYTNTIGIGQKYVLRAAYLFLIITVALAPTNLIVQEMHVIEYGYAPIVGLGTYFLLPVGPLLILGGAINLLKHYRVSRTSQERKRLLYLAIAAAFPIIGGLWDAFTTLPPLSVWSNLLFTILCTIAILKYHLLDIRVFLRKSLVYLLVSFVMAIPYAATLVLVNQFVKPTIEAWWIHALLILFLAIILRPLYNWAQRVVDRLFYRDRYDYLRALGQFSRETQSIVNLKELGSKMTQLVCGALRSTSACLLLLSENKGGLVAVSCTGLERPLSGVVLKNSSPLVEWLQSKGDILSSEELNSIPQLQGISRREQNKLERTGAKLYIPIKTREGRLSGILVLGQRLGQYTYSSEDRELLSSLASQMSMALENARLYDSEKTMLEELEKLDEQKTEFLHGVAHELKTPLTAVISSSEILSEDSPESHRLRERLIANIRTSAESMNRRVTELLDLAQMQIGKLRIEPAPLKIGHAITEMASQLEVLFEKKKQTLALEIPDSLIEVNADRAKLEQVVFNLLSNANKFSPSGSTITLRVREVDRTIIVGVEDSAPAVTREEKERIFDPYYRSADDGKRKRLPGIGLGLAISKRLVELHNGKIWVESQPGKGNTFAFSLPVLDRGTNGAK